MKKYNIVIVGVDRLATELLEDLLDRNFPIGNLCFLEEVENIVSDIVTADEDIYKVVDIASFLDYATVDLVFLCGSTALSFKCWEKFKQYSVVIIDSTLLFLLNDEIPIILPKVTTLNYAISENGCKILSIPSSIATQLIYSIYSILADYNINKCVASTYQSISYLGTTGFDALFADIKNILSYNFSENFANKKEDTLFSHTQLGFNTIPFISRKIDQYNFTEEEIIKHCVDKILLQDINLAVNCVNVPMFIGSSISLYLELSGYYTREEIIESWKKDQDTIIFDQLNLASCVTPFDAIGTNKLYISKISEVLYNAESNITSLMCWLTVDDIRYTLSNTMVTIALQLL